MRLLMISGDRMLSQGKRGAFWYTLELLHEHFERIDIVCPRSYVPSPSLQPFPNVFLHPSPWGLARQPLWILRKGKELIAAHGHRAMTVHEYPPFYNGLGAALLHRATRIPYALEIHHVVGHPVSSSPGESVGWFLCRLFLRLDARRAAAVRVVNADVEQTLVSWGLPASKVRIVPSLYIDTSVWTSDASAPREYDVAFCGRIVAHKGLRELLDALASVPSATLLVIGDGPERRAMERHAMRRGLADRVRFAGWLASQEEVADRLRSARVFVMNSRSEGNPRVAVEAMAAGLPVIATRVGVMPDVIRHGENGILVPMETEALAVAIRDLLADEPLRERMGKEASKVGAWFERREAIANYARFLQSLAS